MKFRNQATKHGMPRKRVGIAYVEERFGKHRNTIRRWIDKGIFPSPDYDPAGHMSWFVDVLDAWESEAYTSTSGEDTNIDACQAAREAYQAEQRASTAT